MTSPWIPQIMLRGLPHTEIKTDLHNDGKSLDSGNFTVTWHGNIPTVTTHGEEQPKASLQAVIAAVKELIS